MIYRQATIDEVNKRFNQLIKRHEDNDDSWVTWKEEFLEEVGNNQTIPYYAFYRGKIIGEAYAVIDTEVGFVTDDQAYLKAFRMDTPFRGQGYFTGLFNFMINDLIQRGYTRFVIGVDPKDKVNKSRYKHYGFTKYLQTINCTNPDGTKARISFYLKYLAEN